MSERTEVPGEARLVRTVSELRELRAGLRSAGRTVGFVPTMGFLHEGHLSLVEVAAEGADAVIVSIFVNPTQFGAGEDYGSYPRDLERDVALCAERGVEVVFAPSEEEVYPVEQSIWVDPGPLAEQLCGLSRPGHFRGVLTVVAKLFGFVEPDAAVFGRKDFQQAVLIRRMVRELGMPIRIEMGDIVREPDGLAMSSRNAYLRSEQREAALSLSRALRRVRATFADGVEDPETLRRLARETVAGAGARVDYVEIVDPAGLEPVERATPYAVCALAAHVGPARLIDNAPLGEYSSLDATRSPRSRSGARET